MRDFCTYFDRHYLDRALVLYESLQRHAEPFRLWVLCFDDVAFAALQHLALPNVIAWREADLFAADPALLKAQSDRSRIEFFFTAGPSWIRQVLAQPGVSGVHYLDADMMFFESAAALDAECDGVSVAITPHRHRRHRLNKFGRFNVGWLYFRRDEIGTACVDWWRERCLEWCFDRVEGSRYADQKYLDEWPARFSAKVVEHSGINLGPWNVSVFPLSESASGQLLTGGQPVVLFHFHGLKAWSPTRYQHGLTPYGYAMTPLIRRQLYEPYIKAWRAAQQRTAEALSAIQAPPPPKPGQRGNWLRRWVYWLRRWDWRCYVDVPAT